jgi:alpha-amylase
MYRSFVFISLIALAACQSPTEKKSSETAPSGDSTVTRHPDWSYQSNIYEVNLREYSTAGTFAAFEKSLPRLKEMGVETLWFMPITPIGMQDRKASPSDMGSYYAVKDYYAVNPDYGNMNDWKNLVIHAHQLGFKVITDWVPNHTSPDNPWIKLHPAFYKKDSTGKPAIPFGWSDTRQLDYSNPEMCDSMIAAMKFWLNETGIDGFRCDVAWNVPDDFWKRAIPQLRAIKEVFILAEGEKPGLHTSGFDETYPWSVMNIAYGIYPGKTTLAQLDSIIDHNDSVYPKNPFRLYFTTNHDENSWNGTEFERFGEGYKAFAVWAFTMKNSVPLIYSGQEEPNKRRLHFFTKDTISWNKYELAGFYKTLNTLRRSNLALRADASFSKIKTGMDEKVYAYLRQQDDHKILVILNLSNTTSEFVIADKRTFGVVKNVFSGQDEKQDAEKKIVLHPWAFLVYDYDAR